MAYTKYSLTPANNTATPPDGAPEGMLPSAVNDTMRDMMAQIRDCGDGIRDGTYTMTAPKITGGTITGAAFTGNTFTSPVISGGTINNAVIGGSTAAAGTFTSLSDSGNLTFTGTGNRITGDFSNATAASAVLFQSSTTNGSTQIRAIPNGTSVVSAFTAFNGTDPDNSAFGQLRINSTVVGLDSSIVGTGTYLPLTMRTGGSERLRIDTSGNVGIGTSSPTRRLHLYASATCDMTIQAGNTTDYSYLYFGDSASATQAWIGYYHTEDSMRFATNAAERMRIDSSGNVGIGTSSPSQKLHVSVSSGNVYTQISSGSNNIYYGWNNANSAASIESPSAITFLSGGSYTERMRIDSSGNVGIGTSSPGCKLDVYNSAAAAANNEILRLRYVTSTTAGHSGDLNFTNATGTVLNRISSVIQDGSNVALVFSNYGSGALGERMRITAGGDLLVGSSTSSVLVSNQLQLGSTSNSSAGLQILNSTTGTGGIYYGDSTTGNARYAGYIEYGHTSNAMLFATSEAERMRINSSGDLCVNMTTSNGATLNITGYNNTYGTAEFSSPKASNNSHIHYGTTGDWYIRPASNSGFVYVKNYVAESDARLKTNIEPITYGLNDILALQPKKFNWIDGGDVENNGFIAQEVEEVLPALVSQGQWKSVDYQGITAILVKAIQELKAELDATKAEVAALKAK